MEYRWILNNQRDGQLIAERLGDRLIRLRRKWWDHDCLDVDPISISAIYRSQEKAESEDPNDWTAIPCPLRQCNGGWEIEVEEDDWKRWVSDQEFALQQLTQYAARAPSSIAQEHMSDAQETIDELKRKGFGWVPVADDLAGVLSQCCSPRMDPA